MLWCIVVFLGSLCVVGSEAQNVLTPIRCYQCRVAKNEDCMKDEYLKTCPSDQAYDVCMSSVVKNEKEFYIEKKCALGPCNLRDKKQNDGLGLDQCDRSRSSYSCFECCKGDGCNTNDAMSATLGVGHVLTLTAAALVVANPRLLRRQL